MTIHRSPVTRHLTKNIIFSYNAVYKIFVKKVVIETLKYKIL